VNITYLRYELLRMFRNRRFFIFSLAFPLVLFYFVAGSQKHQTIEGIPFPTYYLAGMISFGTMSAMMSSGARISGERLVGWNRQLRLTPLSARNYFRAKVITAYTTSLISVAMLFVAGATLGVHLTAPRVLHMTLLVVVGLIPFAAFGILLGHLLTPDSMGPVLGGGIAILSLIGGAYGPLGGDHGFMHDLSLSTPTYWLVRAGRILVGQPAWDATGWIVVASWTVVLAGLAARAYRRDTQRA
jgi:ABC-2 type transport system permease protein